MDRDYEGLEQKKQRREIQIADGRDFKGVWISARLYLARNLSASEKFLLTEIQSLSRNGQCYASNKHFADFIGVTPNMIQKMLKRLDDSGYIKRSIVYKAGTKEIDKRFIILTEKFYDEFVNEHEATADYDEAQPTPIGQNSGEGDGVKSAPPHGKKYQEKYNSILSNTDSKYNNNSYIPKAETLDKSNALAETSGTPDGLAETAVPAEQSADESNSKRTKAQLKEMEADMLMRVQGLCENCFEFSTNITAETVKTFQYYFKRYTERTHKVHPIMTDRTLTHIITMLTEDIWDSDNSESTYMSVVGFAPIPFEEYIDRYFDCDYGRYNGAERDYHMPHFASGGVLLNLARQLSY